MLSFLMSAIEQRYNITKNAKSQELGLFLHLKLNYMENIYIYIPSILPIFLSQKLLFTYWKQKIMSYYSICIIHIK